MAVCLRALVMLAVLVGLPTAWIYYGPLPPSGQRVFDRIVEVAKESLGWNGPLQAENHLISAPHFEHAPQTPLSLAGQSDAENFASFTPVDVEEKPMPAQVEPLLEKLRSLGAAEYTLEKWGIDGQLYRFCCSMPLKHSDALTRHFEAVAGDPLTSIQEVVEEVGGWHSTRLASRQMP